eukprot:2288579-Amphidinium_carterae.1
MARTRATRTSTYQRALENHSCSDRLATHTNTRVDHFSCGHLTKVYHALIVSIHDFPHWQQWTLERASKQGVRAGTRMILPCPERCGIADKVDFLAALEQLDLKRATPSSALLTKLGSPRPQCCCPQEFGPLHPTHQGLLEEAFHGVNLASGCCERQNQVDAETEVLDSQVVTCTHATLDT